MPLVAGQTLSFYEVTGPLGAGAMGEVWRARDTRLDRDVAIKVLPEAFVEDEARLRRFEREAKTLATLNHPNVAQIYGIDQVEDTCFLVLELVEGEDLAERASRGPLPVDEVLRIGRQVALALQAAHAKGIVHRDLKPGNVMRDATGAVKVLDFGIAQTPRAERGDVGPTDASVRPQDEGASAPSDPRLETLESRLTAPGAVAGTVPYMSPEQARGDPLDKRSDIWSFGCLLFELLTGRRPFDRKTTLATLSAILYEEPEWERLPSETPEAVQILLHRCLQKDVDERLHDVADARIEIDELTRSTSTRVLVVPPRRHAATVLIKVAVGSVALAALVLVLNVGGLRERLFGSSRLESLASVVALPSEVVVADREQAGLFLGLEEIGAQEFLTDAVPASLSDRLRVIEGLVTRLPPTHIQLASIDDDLQKVADVYEADAFLVSTVTTEGDSIALEIELVDARLRQALWSHTYAGTRGDYLVLIRTAAEDLRRALRPDAPSLLELVPDRGHSAPAELAFQRGRYHSNRYVNYQDPKDLERAQAAFEEALAAEPGLADAAAEIAWLHGLEVAFGQATPEEALDDVKEWVQRAKEIDPSCGLAWAVLPGFEAFFRTQGSAGSRLEGLLKAARLSPNEALPHNLLGTVLGEFSLSLGARAFQAASEIDPLFLPARANRITTLATVGRLEEALAVLEETELLDSHRPLNRASKATVLSMLGRTVEAKPIVDQLEELAGQGSADDTNSLLEPRLEFELATGDRRAADELLENIRLTIRSPATPAGRVFSLVLSTSSALAVAERVDEAFEILALGDERGLLLPYDYLALNPRLASLRAELRFAEVVAPSRARFREMQTILDAVRARGEMPVYLEGSLDRLVEQLTSGGGAGRLSPPDRAGEPPAAESVDGSLRGE